MTAYATWPENLSIIRWPTVPRCSPSWLYTAVPSTFCEEIRRSVSSTSPVGAAVSVSILYLPFWTAVGLPPLGYRCAVNHPESEGVRRNALDEICPHRAIAQVRDRPGAAAHPGSPGQARLEIGHSRLSPSLSHLRSRPASLCTPS